MDDFVDDTANCFVPEMLVDFVDKNLQQGKEGIEPSSFFITGVCLLVDISGFTKLSGAFCSMGKSGIDELQLATNGYMGKLVEIIYTFGGEIIKFAGDAIICVFSNFVTAVEHKKKGGKLRRSVYDFKHLTLPNLEDPDSSRGSNSHSPLPALNVVTRELPNIQPEVILRAMHCARTLREVQTDKLSVHVAMSCGEMCFGILGGVENRWECLISGPCIHQLSDCLDDAPSKTAVISPECAAILKRSALRTSVESLASLMPDGENHEHPEVVHKSTMQTTTSVYEFELQILPSGNQRIVDITCVEHAAAGSGAKKAVTGRSNPELEQLIRQFVPVPIADGIEQGTGLSYLAEIREVTTMFMKWDSYDAYGKHRNLMDLQACFYQAQRILHSTGAFLRQFLVDDKGCVLIACWGMPHLSYLDNAHRALSAAAQIRYELTKLSMNCSFGITTGDVYCGTVGSALRMEYAAIGSVVNMAARLMGKADGGILVDDATYNRLPSNVLESLKALDPIKVKGRDEPLQVYLYTANTSIHVRDKVVEDHEISAVCKNTLLSVVDRMALKGLAQYGSAGEIQMDQVKQQRSSSFTSVKGWIPGSSSSKAASPRTQSSNLSIVLLSGKDGSGRTTVVVWLKKQALDRQLNVLHVKVGKKDSQVDFMVWKKLFQQLMPKDLFFSNETQRSYVRALLKEVYPGQPQVAKHVGFPVLKAALGITCSYIDGEPTATESSPTWSNGRSLMPRQQKPTAAKVSHASPSMLDSLFKIFAHLLNVQTSLVIVENIENADEESLKLLIELTRLSTRSVLVLTALLVDKQSTSRLKTSLFQMSTKSSFAFQTTPWSRMYCDTIQKFRSTTTIVLENYTPDEIDRMLSAALGVRKVPPEISQLVQDFSGGSYFWVREILQFIKEHGAEQFMSAVGETETTVVVDPPSNPTSPDRPKPKIATPVAHHASARQLTNPKSFAAVRSSRTMSMHAGLVSPQQQAPTAAPSNHSQLKLDKLVLCRFENLHADVQHVLRTASIIGNTFNSTVLYGVLPRHLKDKMSDSLKALLNQKWLYQDSDNEALYQFSHPHAHQIIYELTPSSERSHIHRQVADYIEETYFEDRTQYAALCYHYQQCDTDKALMYCVQAVVAQLGNVNVIFDYAECLELLQCCYACCKTTFDVDCLMKVLSDVRISIEHFDMNLQKPPARSFLAVLLGGCLGLSDDTVSTDSSKKRRQSLSTVSPEQGSSTKGSMRTDEGSMGDGDSNRERNFELQARAYFLAQLDTLNDQLCEKYVDVVDSDVVEEAKEWQRTLLGLSGKNNSVVSRFMRTISADVIYSVDSRKHHTSSGARSPVQHHQLNLQPNTHTHGAHAHS